MHRRDTFPKVGFAISHAFKNWHAKYISECSRQIIISRDDKFSDRYFYFPRLSKTKKKKTIFIIKRSADKWSLLFGHVQNTRIRALSPLKKYIAISCQLRKCNNIWSDSTISSFVLLVSLFRHWLSLPCTPIIDRNIRAVRRPSTSFFPVATTSSMSLTTVFFPLFYPLPEKLTLLTGVGVKQASFVNCSTNV